LEHLRAPHPPQPAGTRGSTASSRRSPLPPHTVAARGSTASSRRSPLPPHAVAARGSTASSRRDRASTAIAWGTAGELRSLAVPRTRDPAAPVEPPDPGRLLSTQSSLGSTLPPHSVGVRGSAELIRRPQDPGSRGSGGAAGSRAYPLDPVKSPVPASSPFRCSPRVDKVESGVPTTSSIHFHPPLDRGASPLPTLADASCAPGRRAPASSRSPG
jgi:hypothetical protein